jgi:hypothetical protein
MASPFQGNVIRNEPVLIIGLVEAILGLFLAFGVDISNEAVGAIMAVTTVILAIIARMFVTPVTGPQYPKGESL